MKQSQKSDLMQSLVDAIKSINEEIASKMPSLKDEALKCVQGSDTSGNKSHSSHRPKQE